MMNTLFSKMIPHDIPQFTKKRLGKEQDGGYVIPMDVLKEIEAVVVFGICDEDSFEQDLAKHLDPKGVPFFLCDPFVGYTAAGKNEFTFQSIGLAGETKENMITLPDFLRRHGLEGKKIFLKIDIEGAEWDSFAKLQASDLENVMALVIEFHRLIHLQELDQQNKTFKLLNSMFILNHCHANNNGLVFRHGEVLFPDVLECTYVSKKWLEDQRIQTVPRREMFPSELDQPCIHVRPDYPIGWWIR